MIRLLSVSSSRADVGVLEPVWRALAATPACELHVLLTGMHTLDDSMARTSLPPGVPAHTGGADLSGGAPEAAAQAMARIQADAGALLAEIRPDIVVVMGDRLDMLPAAVATLPFNLPLAHLHGGEVTEGAVDDRIRHAISKLAHVHCVSSEGARDCLRAMGINSATIYVTGAPGLDTLRSVPELGRAAFAREAGLDGDIAGLRLVTVHAETNAPDPLAPSKAVMAALAARPAPTLFTAPNSDPGGAEIRRGIEAFVGRHSWARFRDTLGAQLYANAMRHAAIMVGNSSSGIIEAGLFGLPAINVGDRQKGRERGPNVVDVLSDHDTLVRALDRLGPAPARFESCTPYGDGAAGPRVAAAILAFAANFRTPARRNRTVRAGAAVLDAN